MFLTPPQVEELTGLRQYAAQRRWLTKARIPFHTRVDGRPVVLVADISRTATEPPVPRPRFDLVRPAR